MQQHSAAQQRIIHAGDIIYLDMEEVGYLHVEGFSDKRIGCLSHTGEKYNPSGPPRFQECLFRIYPKLQYEMHKLLSKGSTKDLPQAEMENLRQKANREAESNSYLMASVEDSLSPILYGETIQLQHVKTGKFLVACSRTLAEMDKGKFRIGLLENGSSKSWFSFRPKYKTRTAGGNVYVNDFVIIERAKHTDQCFHSSNSCYKRDRETRQEVNLHHFGSRFQVKKYAEGISKKSKTLQVGRVYRLYHLEAESFITASCNEYLSKSPYLRQILPDSRPLGLENSTTKSMFVLEGETRLSGGVVMAKKQYRFRHLATGRYLSVDTTRVESGNSAADVSTFQLSLSKLDGPSTMFTLHPSDDSSEALTSALEAPSVRIEHPYKKRSTDLSCWIHSTALPKANVGGKTKASLKLCASEKRLEQDSFRLIEAADSEVSDALSILSRFEVLKQYKERLDTVQKEKRIMCYKDVDDIFETLREIIFFLVNSSDTEALSSEGAAISHRQNLCRQAKLIDQIYDLLLVPGKCGILYSDLEKVKEFKVIAKIHEFLNKAIVNLCLDNIESKLYIANKTFSKWNPTAPKQSYLKETMAQMGSGTGFQHVYCSLFSNNPKLLYAQVDNALLEHMCLGLRKQGVYAEGVLNFLAILCSCLGHKISKNQELILENLFDINTVDCSNNRQQFLVETAATKTRFRPISPSMKSFVYNCNVGSQGFDTSSEPVGFKTLEIGLADILVSWTSCQEWTPGKYGLFVTPSELGISSQSIETPEGLRLHEKRLGDEIKDRKWIRLEELTWTLDPENFYAKIHDGRSWLEEKVHLFKSPDHQKRFDRIKSLAKYYDLQLKLFARLVQGRSLACMKVLGQQFSYEMLLSGITNNNLPYCIRTSYSSILHGCYIDCYPHEVKKLPSVVRNEMLIDRIDKSVQHEPVFDSYSLNAEHHHPALKSEDAFVKYPHFNKFALLQAIINEVLINLDQNGQNITHKEENKFTNSILDTLEYLVEAGFYSDHSILRNLCNSLVGAMDGRADQTENWIRNNNHYNKGVLSVSLDGDGDETKRYSIDDKSLLVMSSKRKLCGVLDKITKMYANFRVSYLLSYYKYNQDQILVKAEGLPTLENAAVREIEGIFMPIDDDTASDTLAAAGDVISFSISPLHTICCDLIMYSSPELVDAALGILIDLHSTREDAVANFLDLQVVEGQKQIESFMKLRVTLNELTRNTEIFQSMLLQFVDADNANKYECRDVAEKMIQSVKWLEKFCDTRVGQVGVRDSTLSPDREKQDLLLKVKVLDPILSVMRIRPFGSDQFLRNQELQEVKTQCSYFLCALMADNPRTQDAVYDHIDELMSIIDQDIRIGQVLVGIFNKNRRLCLRVPKNVIWTIANLIEVQEDTHSLDSVLEFFCTYVAPGGIPEKRNQIFLFYVLTSPQFKNVCVSYAQNIHSNMEVSSKELRGTSGYIELLRLVSSAEKSDVEKLRYYKNFIKLCSLMSQGKNCRTEVGFQQLLPLNFILTVMLDSAITYDVKNVMGRFLSDVYFDTDLEVDSGLTVMPAIWRLLMHCQRTISSYVAAIYDARSTTGLTNLYDRQSLKALREYTFSGVMPVLTSFFNYVHDPLADDIDSNCHHIVEALKSEVNNLFKRGDMDASEQQVTFTCGIAMGVYRKGEEQTLVSTIKRGIVYHPSLTNCTAKEISKRQYLANMYSTENPLERFKVALQGSSVLTENSKKEFNALAEVFQNISRQTNRQDPEYISKRKKEEKYSVADKRANTISMKDLCRRIISHIQEFPKSVIAVSTLELLSRIVSLKKLSEEQKKTMQVVQVKKAEEEHQKMQVFMGECGAAELVVSLISGNADEAVVLKAIRLGIEILDGGCTEVQELIYDAFIQADDKFFFQMDFRLQMAMEAIKAERRDNKYNNERAARKMSQSAEGLLLLDDASSESSEVVAVSPVIIFRFLQLLTEGHNIKMQEALLNQACLGNTKNYSLVQRGAGFLSLIAKDEMFLLEMDRQRAELLLVCWEFLIELVQGPCSKNQEFLAQSVMVEVFRKVLNAKFPSCLSKKLVKTIKSKAVKATVSLIEGREDERIQNRLSQTIELKSLKKRLKAVFESYQAERGRGKSSTWDEEYLEEGFDILTLMKTVFKDSPELSPSATNPAPKIEDFRTDAQFEEATIAYRASALYEAAYFFFTERHCSVEVYWGVPTPQLDQIFFPKPSHCQLLPFIPASKEIYLQQLEYGSETRLTLFVEGSKGIDEELQHIELLSKYWIYNVVRPYIPLFKKASFTLALLMNLVMLVSLTHGFNGVTYSYEPNNMELSMTVFGCGQLILSTLVLVFIFLVRVPLVYQKRWNAYTAITMKRYKKSKQLSLSSFGAGLGGISAIGSGLGSAIGSGLNSAMDVTGNARRLRSEFKHRVYEILGYYKATLRYGFVLAALQIMFVQAWPELTPVLLFLVLSVLFLLVPTATATRAYLEDSTIPFAFVFCIVYDVVVEKYTAFYVAYLASSFLGFFYHPCYYAYHLLDLVVMSSALQNVVRAVTKPRKALMMTAILGAFTIYFFSLALFFFLPGDAYDPEVHRSHCKTMLRCFFTILHRGLLSGGGAGEFLTNELGFMPSFVSNKNFAMRTIYDLAFFVVVLVLLLNIIFGIIIDTFSELRSQTSERQSKMKNQCFICAIPSQEFENYYMRKGIPNGFAKHIKEQHNMWNYVFFLVYLRSKSKTECTGAESYVLDNLENDDLSWIPQGMAKCLNTTVQESMEEQMAQVKGELHKVRQDLKALTSLLSAKEKIGKIE